MSTVPAATPASGLAALLLLVMAITYQVIVGVSIWRSAGRYRGKPMWAALARAAIAAQVAGPIMRIIYGLFGPGR